MARRATDVVQKNYAAIEAGMNAIEEIHYPESWANAHDRRPSRIKVTDDPYFVNFIHPILAQEGDKLPVSMLSPDGTVPTGTTKYEKRGIAVDVPRWIPENCIQCNQWLAGLPARHHPPVPARRAGGGKRARRVRQRGRQGQGAGRAEVPRAGSPLDCTGCGNCVDVCPAKEKALKMAPLSEAQQDEANWNYAHDPHAKGRGREHQGPSRAASSANRCSSSPARAPAAARRRMSSSSRSCLATAWSWPTPRAAPPFTAAARRPARTTKNAKGQGPAWANSLFEDNAEFGFGLNLANKQRRARLADTVRKLIAVEWCDQAIKDAGAEWLANMDDAAGSRAAGEKLLAACRDRHRRRPNRHRA